jgi:hypothetical protein
MIEAAQNIEATASSSWSAISPTGGPTFPST